MPKHLTEKDLVISSNEPINPKPDCIWINTDTGLIQVFLNKQWNHLGYYSTSEVDSKIADLNVTLNNLYNKKVDKVAGKVLSSNNFTNTLKNKLDGIENGANNYIHPTGDNYLHMTNEQKTRWLNNDSQINLLNETKADDAKLEDSHLNLYSNGRKISSVEIPYLSEIRNIDTKIEEFKREFLDETFNAFGFGTTINCTNTMSGVVKSIVIRGTEDRVYDREVYTIISSDTDTVLRSVNSYKCELILEKSLRKRGDLYDTIELVGDKYCAIYRVDNAEPVIKELSKDIDLALKGIRTYNKLTKITVRSLYSVSEIKAYVASTLLSNILNIFVNIQGMDEQLSLLEFAAMTMSLNLKDIEKEIETIVGGN